MVMHNSIKGVVPTENLHFDLISHQEYPLEHSACNTTHSIVQSKTNAPLLRKERQSPSTISLPA